MAKLIMDDAGTLKSSIKTLSSILDEIDFELGEEGLKAEGMDPSNVALVRFALSPKAFRTFSVDGDQVFGLDLNRAGDVFSRAKSGDEIELEVSDDGSQLKVILRGENTRRFEVPLMDPVDKAMPELDFDTAAEAEVRAGLVKEALKDAELIDDDVEIGFSEGQFGMSAESDNRTFTMDVSETTDAIGSLSVESDLENEYGIDYLKNGLKSANSGEMINLRTGQGNPVIVEIDLVDGNGKIVFILAPKVETE